MTLVHAVWCHVAVRRCLIGLLRNLCPHPTSSCLHRAIRALKSARFERGYRSKRPDDDGAVSVTPQDSRIPKVISNHLVLGLTANFLTCALGHRAKSLTFFGDFLGCCVWHNACVLSVATRGKHVNRLMMRLVEDESGQDLIEYGLLAGLISLACVTIVITVGGGVGGVYVNLEQQTAALSN